MIRTSGTLRTFIAGSAMSAAISATLATAGESDPNELPTRGSLPYAPAIDIAARGPAAPVVFNCADSGTGSLRAAVSGAAAGDTIDLTQLSCSEITLTTGSIVASVDDLSVIAAGPYSLSIENFSDVDAYPDARVFTHTGTGT